MRDSMDTGYPAGWHHHNPEGTGFGTEAHNVYLVELRFYPSGGGEGLPEGTDLAKELTRVIRANADIFESISEAIKKEPGRMLEALPAAPGAADPTVAENIIKQICECPLLKDILPSLIKLLGA